MRATVHQNTAPKQSNGLSSAYLNKREMDSQQEQKEAFHLGKSFPKPGVAGSAGYKPPPPISFDFSKLPIFPLQQARIQPKLKINPPGDRYEQESDRVAEQVMQMPAPQVQRKLLWGSPTQSNPFAIQRKCEACAKDEEETLQAKSVGNTGGIVAPGIAQQIQSSRGGGQPMDMGTRSFMEARLGADFGGVRIHTDNNAALFNQKLQAKAFTLGSDVFFNQGQYNPGAGNGRQLLAHELTHVVQQEKGPNSIQRQVMEEEENLGEPADGDSPQNPTLDTEEVSDETAENAIAAVGELDEESQSPIQTQSNQKSSPKSKPKPKPKIKAIDVDLSSQKATITFDDGTIVTTQVSTGKGHDKIFTEGNEPTDRCKNPGVNNSNCTPTGSFTIGKKGGEDYTSGKGDKMRYYVELKGQGADGRGIGFHDSQVVNGTPLSHGCIRVPMGIDEVINKGVSEDTQVSISGKSKIPADEAAKKAAAAKAEKAEKEKKAEKAK